MPATDNFNTESTSETIRHEASLRVLGSARRDAVITPNDSADLTEVPRAIRCNAAGDVKLILVGNPVDATGVVYTVAAGEVLDVRPRRVLATGTDVAAGSLVAWY